MPHRESRKPPPPRSEPRAWSFLGSHLWLRLLEPRDLPRARAFLRRRDLVRAGNTEAPLHASRLRAGDVPLLAVDPFGAPAGVLHLHEVAGELHLSFAVPGDALPVLRECVRLLITGLPLRMKVKRMSIPAFPGDASFMRTIQDVEQDPSGAWVTMISRPTESPASHAH